MISEKYCKFACKEEIKHMTLPKIQSVKRIEQQFHTGEEPVLAMCSDVNTYVCKYMRSSAAAYKLVCELVGALMAKAWQLNTPDVALVMIKPAHWDGVNLMHSVSAPSLGSRWQDSVVDITPSTFERVPATKDTLNQLMKIALYDFWIANEDRNANNANLMYDVSNGQLVSIDYGCIFNTASFDYPLSQLTSTDTILWSDLFTHLAEGQNKELGVEQLRLYYKKSIQICQRQKIECIKEIPKEWNVPFEIIQEKVNQLFDEKWIEDVWNNFVECLNENINHE